MEEIEDYDEECVNYIKSIEKNLKEWQKLADADKAGHLESVRIKIQKLRQSCMLYKSELYLVPRA